MFAKLNNRRLERKVFRSTIELRAEINALFAQTNDNPKPFNWTVDSEKLFAALKRKRRVFNFSR